MDSDAALLNQGGLLNTQRSPVDEKEAVYHPEDKFLYDH
jgi:hypothetical protein